MPSDINTVSILKRREIEALIAAPLIKEFMKEIEKEKTLQIVKRVINDMALQNGRQLAGQMGGNSIEDFAKGISLWARGDAYDIDVLEKTDRKFSFNIKRCKYVEMYKNIGLSEFGYLLSCGRDFAMVEGFNPKMKLARTKTVMEGKDCCDFRITLD